MTLPYHVIAMPTFRVGNETQVVVEFSPYQKVPTEKSKADNRIATIEEGMFQNMHNSRCAIYGGAIQMKITYHSSNHWRITIPSHLTRKHLNI